MEYSIVVPAYNESDKITASLTNIVNFMRGYCGSFEVLVVDDGSSDQTVSMVEKFSSENPEVRLIKNPHKGKGYAVYRGVLESSGDLIYLCDADLSAPISELKKLSVWLKEQDYDIVVASREGTGAVRVSEPFYRHLMGRVFNLWVQILVLPGIQDSQCGFKLMKHDVAKEAFKRLKIYGDTSKELKRAYLGAFDVEVLYITKKLRFKIKEVPVVWTYVKTTRLNPLHDSFKMATDVLKIKLNDIRGMYNI